jgi:hypothetical protein
LAFADDDVKAEPETLWSYSTVKKSFVDSLMHEIRGILTQLVSFFVQKF